LTPIPVYMLPFPTEATEPRVSHTLVPFNTVPVLDDIKRSVALAMGAGAVTSLQEGVSAAAMTLVACDAFSSL
jgi:hypothetical protein